MRLICTGVPYALAWSGGGDDRALVIFTLGNGYGNGNPYVNRFVLLADGTVVRGQPLPDPFWYGTFDGREYVVATAPLVALTWPLVAIADRHALHVVSVVRRRTMTTR